jgi:hypothetical protein
MLTVTIQRITRKDGGLSVSYTAVSGAVTISGAVQVWKLDGALPTTTQVRDAIQKDARSRWQSRLHINRIPATQLDAIRANFEGKSYQVGE